mmetsp:Transcript_1619/g.1554  ORF Transcript_1619/g.1554 Transcript_1619/m.1554 type:complete len:328 (+) Transcript_1619:1112-2095(+)
MVGESDLDSQGPFNLTSDYMRMGGKILHSQNDKSKHSNSQSPIAKELNTATQLKKPHKAGSPLSQSPPSKKTSFYCGGNEELSNFKFRNMQCSKLGLLSGDDGPGQKIATQGILLLRKLARDGCVCLKKGSMEQSSSKTTLKGERKVSIYQEDSIIDLPQEEENPGFICGEYCRKMEAKNQKVIIRNMMKRGQGPNLNVFTNKGDQGFINERKYIIDAKWWQRWCDYTGFETTTHETMESEHSFMGNQVLKTSPSSKAELKKEPPFQENHLRANTSGNEKQGKPRNVKERTKLMVEKTLEKEKRKRDKEEQEPFESSNMKMLRIEIM